MAPRRPRKITGRNLVDYGSPVNRDVNVDEASKKLRVSKTAVRKAMRQEVVNLRSVIYRGITGRRDADVGELTNVMGMLQAVYGYGPRGSKVNTKSAAEALGVSAATVRRWANGSQQPSPDHLKAIKTAARQAASTKAGRRAATEVFRNSERGRKALAGGARTRIHVSGYQGPENYAWERDRDVSSDPVPAAEIEGLLRAYEEGGDKGFLAYLTDIMNRWYLGEPWEFATISEFWIGDRR